MLWEKSPSCNVRQRALNTRILQWNGLTHSEGSISYQLTDKIDEMCISGDNSPHRLAKWGAWDRPPWDRHLWWVDPDICAEFSLHNSAVSSTPVLERGLSSYECWLHLQRTQVLSPSIPKAAHITTVILVQGSSTLFWPLRAPGTHEMHRLTHR